MKDQEKALKLPTMSVDGGKTRSLFVNVNVNVYDTDKGVGKESSER
jgi:hypothetical protein